MNRTMSLWYSKKLACTVLRLRKLKCALGARRVRGRKERADGRTGASFQRWDGETAMGAYGLVKHCPRITASCPCSGALRPRVRSACAPLDDLRAACRCARERGQLAGRWARSACCAAPPARRLVLRVGPADGKLWWLTYTP